MARLQKSLGYLLIIGFLAYFGLRIYVGFNKIEKGDKVPPFSTTLINGEKFSISDLEGKWVLIDFWGSWCGPCRSDFPELLALNEELTKDNFEIVSIALEKNKEQGLLVSEQVGFKWKYQIIEERRIVMLSPIAQIFGVTDIPAKFLVSPEGYIQKINDLNSIPELIREN